MSSNNTPRYGLFSMLVDAIMVSLSSTRPVIFTRLVPKAGDTDSPEHLTHAVRLNDPQSQRIGFDELRSAFPGLIGHMGDKDLLTTLIEKTDQFKGLAVDVSVEPQMKDGRQVRSESGQPYFNIRLRSNVRNMSHEAAASIAERLLSGVTASKKLEDAFDDKNEPEEVVGHQN